MWTILRVMSGDIWEPPLNRPVLPGEAGSDDERYLSTEELRTLQNGSGEWVHRDELLFQVVHQFSELRLRLASSHAGTAAVLVGES